MTQFQGEQSPTLRKYRELLGVTVGASEEDLKKAYYQMAFLYHPDRNSDPQAPGQFQQSPRKEKIGHFSIVYSSFARERASFSLLKAE